MSKRVTKIPVLDSLYSVALIPSSWRTGHPKGAGRLRVGTPFLAYGQAKTRRRRGVLCKEHVEMQRYTMIVRNITSVGRRSLVSAANVAYTKKDLF
jgi:hypothetical protein